MKRCLTIPVVLFALSLAAICARGDTIVWVNTSGGNWSVATNWNLNQVPGASDTAAITNTGNYTVTLDVSASVSGLILGAGDGTTQTFLLNGQTFSLAGQATMNPHGVFDLSSGTFKGINGGAIISGILTCSGGALTGTLTLTSNSVINLAGLSNPFNGPILFFTNYGTVNWIYGDLNGQSSPNIYNYGLWDVQTDGTVSGIAFNNYGTFRKSGGVLTLIDNNTTFNNFGIVDVEIGGLDFSYGSDSGVVSTATNAFTQLANFVLTGNPSFIGPVNFTGSLTGSNAVVHGAEIFNGTLSGTITLAADNVLNNSGGNITFNNLVLTNYGTVIWTNNDLSGQASPRIYNYGLWDETFNANWSDNGGTTIFNNYGTFRKSGGTLADNPTVSLFYATFNNFGIVDVESGGLDFGNGSDSGVVSTATNAFTQLASFVLTGNPSFSGPARITGDLAGSNAVVHGMADFYGPSLSGTITLASNNVLNIDDPVSFNNLLLTNYGTVEWGITFQDSTALSGNNAQVANYGLWDTQTNGTMSGIIFKNYGTFRKSGGAIPSNTTLDASTTFTNFGTADVQTGLLVLSGTNSLSGGTLNFGIGATNNFGSISLHGNARLTGALSANLNNGFSPAISNSFPVVTYGSKTGIFTNLNLPLLQPGRGWKTNYTATTLNLKVISVPLLQLSSVKVNLKSNSISFSWSAHSGWTYQLQGTTNLVPANWVNVGAPISGTNGTMKASPVFGSISHKFFRIQMH